MSHGRGWSLAAATLGILALASTPALAATTPASSGASSLGAAAGAAFSAATLRGLMANPEFSLMAIVAGVVVLPGILLLMTSFTRIVVVLSLARTAVGTATTPPNQVIIALALILTMFSMAPTLNAVNRQAITPYMAGRIGIQTALRQAEAPVKSFMAQGTIEQNLLTLIQASGQARPKTLAQVPLLTLIPAFAVSQLTLAFQMGFLLFLPFLLIDFLVSSVLMSLGMMMLPPTVVSLPFKILLFVLVNGWGLLVGTLVTTTH